MKKQRWRKLLYVVGITLIILFCIMIFIVVYKELEYKRGVDFYQGLRSGGMK